MPLFSNVAAVLVHWNCSEDLLSCVDHLRKNFPELRIIVVDNGSERHHLRSIKTCHAIDYLLEEPLNAGYGAGMNRAASKALSEDIEWLWLTNPDSRPHIASLPALLAQSRDAAAIGGLQTSSNHPEMPASPYISAGRQDGGRIRPFECSGCRHGHHDVDVLTGTGLLVRAVDFVRVGGMDEAYFHYKEEFDLMVRLRLLAPLRFVCSAVIWHQRGGSLHIESGAAVYYSVRNEFLFNRRNGRRPRSVWKDLRWTIRQAPPLLSDCLKRRSAERARHRILAISHGWSGVIGPLPSPRRT